MQGSLLLIRHLANGTIYRVKSNALYGLVLGENASVSLGWASFSGKATYQEPGWLEPKGSYEFLVYVEGRNEPGSGVDRAWVKVLDGLAMDEPASDHLVEIMGGNIVVPHQSKVKVK